jgi:hypothetical protein
LPHSLACLQSSADLVALASGDAAVHRPFVVVVVHEANKSSLSVPACCRGDMSRCGVWNGCRVDGGRFARGGRDKGGRRPSAAWKEKDLIRRTRGPVCPCRRLRLSLRTALPSGRYLSGRPAPWKLFFFFPPARQPATLCSRCAELRPPGRDDDEAGHRPGQAACVAKRGAPYQSVLLTAKQTARQLLCCQPVSY